MYSDKYQRKLFPLLSSGGSQPLAGWRVQTKDGAVQTLKDEELRATVVEVKGCNVATTHLTSPPPPHHTLGLSLPCLTLLVKYLDLPFSFEVQILDEDGMRRRFRFSTYQSAQRVTTFTTVMGLALTPGWNVVQLDLAEFTRHAYGARYLETLAVQVHANCRLRKIYFSDRLYRDQELPKEYRLCLLNRDGNTNTAEVRDKT